MPYQIGTDEAGYGPNLGPLVVSGTLWHIDSLDGSLMEKLDHCCSARKAAGKIHVGDSKQVYKGRLVNLESGVLAILYAWSGRLPRSLGELCELLGTTVQWKHVLAAGYPEITLPRIADPRTIEQLGEELSHCASSNGVGLEKVETALVFPQEFNRQIETLGNKASLLSATTLKLVRRILDFSADSAPEHTLAICDKHGGRGSYAGLLQQYVTNNLLQTIEEGREQSCYRWREKERNIDIRFVTGGESFFPTAVASMVSKYVRELFMAAWNQFWQQEVPGLKPTKGYPVDAKRFYAEIRPAREKLKIGNADLWRCR